MRRTVILMLTLLAGVLPARAETTPLTQDPLGPMTDVTADWEAYQPADDFCIPLDGFDLYRAWTGDDGEACDAEATYRVRVQTPPLCGGCRRFFLDYSQISENDPAAGLFFAHGHAYFRLHSWNPSYTVDPLAHSPNIKNLTNDKAVNPSGSPQEQLSGMMDTYAMSYVGDTRLFHHNEVQGPYYVGPWYLNGAGAQINGAYLDVNVGGATPAGVPEIDELRYWAGFDAGEASCPHNMSEYQDGDAFYGGCAAHPGMGATAIDPYSSI